MSQRTPFSDIDAPLPEVLQKLVQGLLASEVALALFTPSDDLHFATDDFRALYAVQPGEQSFASIMRHCHKHKVGPLIESDDIEAWLEMACAKRRSTASRRFEIDMVDGRWLWASEAVFGDGWILLMITDCTFVKQKEFRLRNARDAAITAAETDYLTGLPNRRAMMNQLGAQIERSIVTGAGLSIALIDLDHFKSINDGFGHETGDRVLQDFAACATETLREGDLFGRVGGEEFLLLMPGTDQDRAVRVLERLRLALHGRVLRIAGVKLRYTFSGGIAQWRAGKTLDDLYREADIVLYQAKEAGRDQVRQAG